jgi:hypothetical protein
VAVHLSVGDRSWTVEELAARSGEFFPDDSVPGVLPLRAGIGG